MIAGSGRRLDSLAAGPPAGTRVPGPQSVLGLLLLVAWSAALLVELARRRADPIAAGLAAALAAVLVVAVQTDVLAVPWLTYCLWSLAGAAVAPAAWPARAATPASVDTVEA